MSCLTPEEKYDSVLFIAAVRYEILNASFGSRCDFIARSVGHAEVED